MKKRLLWAIAALALFLGMLFLLLSRGEKAQPVASSGGIEKSGAEAFPGDSGPSMDLRHPSDQPAVKTRSREQARQAHQERVKRIRDALKAHLAAKAAGKGGAEESVTPPPLSAEYLDEAIRASLGSLTSCYDSALKRIPELQGKMLVRFSIVADEEYGGVVEDAAVQPQKGFEVDDEFSQCVSDAVYDFKNLPAPEDGGTLDGTLPIVMTSSD